MKNSNLKMWGLMGFIHVALLIQTLFAETTYGSVLPRPNLKHRSTTQIASITMGNYLPKNKNYSEEGTIVIVTSSELPKQIPPPPTPTKPHKPTSKYDNALKETLYGKNRLYQKEFLTSLHVS